MHIPNTAQAYITVPSECLPLVAELVSRLGGTLTSDEGNTLDAFDRGGATLKALRLKAGLTQKDVADALGIAQSHISGFEKNRRGIPYKHAQKLAEILHSLPGHFMTPNAETIAAMNESGKDTAQGYASTEELYADLGL